MLASSENFKVKNAGFNFMIWCRSLYSREDGGEDLEKTGMRMLRRIKGVMLRDRERSADIRREIGVSDIDTKVKR